MGWLEIVALALRFLFGEFPRLLEQYKLYRLDKKYESQEEAYLEALIQYKRAKLNNDKMEKLKALRSLGKK